MKNLFKGKLGTVIILAVTVILAGVAIFTALRLYQLGNQPVAPNVPSSIPKAAENACTLSFIITTPTPTPTPTPVPQCNDTCTTDAGCPSGLSCSSGHCRNAQCSSEISCICLTPTPTATPTATPTPTPTPTPVPQCNDTCTTDTSCPSNLSCSSGHCRNAQCSSETSCICPTPTPTATPTATPTPTASPNLCGGTCGSNNNCQSDYVCFQGFCRNPSCTDQVTCSCPGTPNICGGTCGSDSNCRSGLTCYQGFCRNPSCPSQASCACPSTSAPTPTPTQGRIGTSAPAPTPTAPTLPVSGTDWPTILGAGIGIFVIIGSLLLAL